MTTVNTDSKFLLKREMKAARRKEQTEMKNTKRLIEMDVKKKGGSKAEVVLRMAEVQFESAKRLAAQSKEQIKEQFVNFDEMVTVQAGELLSLVRDIPNGIELPETISSELTRLTQSIDSFTGKRKELEESFNKIDITNPLTANAELLDVAAELNSMQMDIATIVLPAAMDLYNLAPKEIAKIKARDMMAKNAAAAAPVVAESGE